MPLNSIPPTTTVAALRGQAGGRPPTRPTSTSASGAAPCPATSPTCDRCTRRASSASSASCCTRASTSSRPSTPASSQAALAETAAFDGLLIVHAEDAQTIDASPPAARARAMPGSCASRPQEAEERAIAQVDRRRPRDRRPGAHPAPVDADALPLIAEARAEGVRLTRRDLPALPDARRRGDPRRRDAVQVLPAHPRGAATATGSGQGLADGVIDIVVSDHSPCTADLKRLDTGDFGEAWGGIACLQLGLPAVWTEARAAATPSPTSCGGWRQAPARQVGLADRGRIAVGLRRRPRRLRPRRGVHRRRRRPAPQEPRVSAYAGRTLAGVVRRPGCAACRSTSTPTRAGGS